MNQNDVREATAYFKRSLKLMGAIKNKSKATQEAIKHCDTVVIVLEKQLAKPLKTVQNYPDEEETGCAVCGNPCAGDGYCGCCGQKLDWSSGNVHDNPKILGGSENEHR